MVRGLTDAQGRERLQAELARKTAILTEVVHRVPVGISLLWGPELRYELVNDLHADFLPRRGQVVGRTVAEVFPEHADLARAFYEPVRATGETATFEDYPLPFPGDPESLDGFRYYSATVVQVPGASAEDTGVLSVFRETTAEVRRRRGLERELEAEHRISHILQQSLVPESLPRIEGVELAARYRPAGTRVEAGGDFYDAFQACDGAWLLVVGDVCGKGPEAAAVTSLARHTLRAAAMFTGDPDHLFRILNQALLRAGTELRFCTAVCARIDLVGPPARLGVLSAGHPCALVARAGGRIEEVGGKGGLLGVSRDPVYELEEVDLVSGDRVLLYTDGLTEAQAPGRVLEAADLHPLLGSDPDEDLAHMLARLEAGAVPAEAGELRDDVAMIALRLPVSAS